MGRMAELSADVAVAKNIKTIRPFDVALVERQVAELLAEYPEIGDDEQLKADMIEGSTDLPKLLDRLLSVELGASNMLGSIALRMSELEARHERYEKRKADVRKTMLRVMSIAGLPRLVLTEATLVVANTAPATVVTDPEQIPDEFWKETVSRRPDMKALKQALIEGATISGAYLNNGSQSLRIL